MYSSYIPVRDETGQNAKRPVVRISCEFGGTGWYRTQLCKLLRVRGALDARVAQDWLYVPHYPRHTASYILIPVLAGDAAEYLTLGSGSQVDVGLFAL